MQYLDAISKMTELSLLVSKANHSISQLFKSMPQPVPLKGKPFNITVIQVYAPTSNAEETEVEWFYEDLQDLLELTPQKISFSL